MGRLILWHKWCSHCHGQIAAALGLLVSTPSCRLWSLLCCFVDILKQPADSQQTSIVIRLWEISWGVIIVHFMSCQWENDQSLQISILISPPVCLFTCKQATCARTRKLVGLVLLYNRVLSLLSEWKCWLLFFLPLLSVVYLSDPRLFFHTFKSAFVFNPVCD